MTETRRAAPPAAGRPGDEPAGPGPGRSRAEVVAALALELSSPSEARWMVEHVAGASSPGRGRGALDAHQLAELASLVRRRTSGEPLQYVLGTWPFRRVELAVDRRALVPRPETEQVVEMAMELVGTAAGPVVVDLGTGTGAIALSMAVELAPSRPGLAVWATDADPDAIELADENRTRVAVAWPAARVEERVHLVTGDWFGALPARLRGRVDLVVANPPYVAAEEWPGLDPEVRLEPYRALVAATGSDGTPGMGDVEQVITGAVGWLAPGGWVVVEVAPRQARPAAAVARRLGFVEVSVLADLAGRDRAVAARRPAP